MSDTAVADDAEIPQEGTEAAPKKGKKKLLVLVAAPVLALLLIGGGLWATGITGKLFGGSAEKHEAPPAPKKTVFYDLPDLLVNLSGSGRKTNFLKLTIALELEDAADVPKLQAVMPRIIDSFQTYLRELRAEDLKGSAGMYRVREELLTRVGGAVAPVKVVDVLFKEMLVQ